MLLPSFSPHCDRPALPEEGAGLVLCAAPVEGQGGSARWPLHGSFRVPLTAAREAEPESVLRELVIAIQHGSTHDLQACHVIQDEVLFPEDVSVDERWISGSFQVDLLGLFELVAEHDHYYITAYLGACVPVTVKQAAQLPWLAPPLEAAKDDAHDEHDERELDDPEEPDDDDRWMVDDPV